MTACYSTERTPAQFSSVLQRSGLELVKILAYPCTAVGRQGSFGRGLSRESRERGAEGGGGGGCAAVLPCRRLRNGKRHVGTRRVKNVGTRRLFGAKYLLEGGRWTKPVS